MDILSILTEEITENTINTVALDGSLDEIIVDTVVENMDIFGEFNIDEVVASLNACEMFTDGLVDFLDTVTATVVFDNGLDEIVDRSALIDKVYNIALDEIIKGLVNNFSYSTFIDRKGVA